MGVFDQFRLDGKTALVTGGDRGIGRAISDALAEAGADVAVNYHTHEEKAEQTARELEEWDVDTMTVQADVSKQNQVQDMVSEVRDWDGPIDILVNNAGVAESTPALEHTEGDFEHMFGVNMKGVFFCSQEIGRSMVKRGEGSILNISSISGFISNPHPQVAYNSSKAAVTMITRSLASEWAEHGVRVNEIAPGYTNTDMTQPFKDNNPEMVEEQLLPSTPMGRMADPDELRGAALYLVSDAASFVTGESLVVDGGFSIM